MTNGVSLFINTRLQPGGVAVGEKASRFNGLQAAENR